MKRKVEVYCGYVKGVSNWKLQICDRMAFSGINAIENGMDLELGA